MVHNQKHNSEDTIAACASAQGKSGVAVIRVSGSQSWAIAESLTQSHLSKPGFLRLASLLDGHGQLIDKAMMVAFRNPASFTGEDTIELHCHGSPIVIEMLLERIYQLGARPAEPGEFSKRAFLNNKIDLTKAEAIADLIDASSRQAARNAMQSLQGLFAEQVHSLVHGLTQIRILIEAHLDFPEEDIESGDKDLWINSVQQLLQTNSKLQKSAEQGCRINNGFRLVLLGAPNSGKSSLFNALLKQDRAIVTDQAGTTRDLLQQPWQLGGLQLELSDTAGLRSNSQDKIENIGMEKAMQAANTADYILYLFDQDKPDHSLLDHFSGQKVTLVHSKSDLGNRKAELGETRLDGKSWPIISLSAKTGAGLDLLTSHLQQQLIEQNQQENVFSARQRHLDALAKAAESIKQALYQLEVNQLELSAQDLLDAQNSLGQITGTVSSDDLLGEIFSSFCIGK